MHVCLYVFSHSHTHTHKHKHTHARAHTHTRMHTHTHTRMHTHTHTHTHTHVRTHTHTHRFVQYVPTSLERSYKHDYLTEADMGVLIDLIVPETYSAPDGQGGSSELSLC